MSPIVRPGMSDLFFAEQRFYVSIICNIVPCCVREVDYYIELKGDCMCGTWQCSGPRGMCMSVELYNSSACLCDQLLNPAPTNHL